MRFHRGAAQSSRPWQPECALRCLLCGAVRTVLSSVSPLQGSRASKCFRPSFAKRLRLEIRSKKKDKDPTGQEQFGVCVEDSEVTPEKLPGNLLLRFLGCAVCLWLLDGGVALEKLARKFSSRSSRLEGNVAL